MSRGAHEENTGNAAKTGNAENGAARKSSGIRQWLRQNRLAALCLLAGAGLQVLCLVRGERRPYLWLLGVEAAVLLYWRERQAEKEAEKRRKDRLMREYPELVSKLLIFAGAGLSVRNAWEMIFRTDEERDGPAYEELRRMVNRLRAGEPESRVYRDFGRSCGLRQYMKLAGLLEQNRRAGVADLADRLSLEMVEAWEERKNDARRLGEEAGTKLLLPLMMMLVVTMVIILVPALMNFRF